MRGTSDSRNSNMYTPRTACYNGIGYILSTIFWTGVKSNYECSQIIERIHMCPHHDLDGYIASSSYSLWSRTDRDMVHQCAADCHRDPRCQAFFYNRLTFVCQGHPNSSLSTADAVPEAGWVYYRYCPRTDCADIRSYSHVDGIYTVAPSDGLEPIRVFCDMRTDGGGWMVFQRRTDGSVDFFRGWDEYKSGFGFLENEFWLGNDNIHRLTSQKPYRLRIDVADFEGGMCMSTYSRFYLASEDDLYMLTTGGTSGDCGSGFTYGNGRNFTTFDRDNDVSSINCAISSKGGWWFGKCHSVHLNGVYNSTEYAAGINWFRWRGYSYSLKFTDMKLRPL